MWMVLLGNMMLGCTSRECRELDRAIQKEAQQMQVEGGEIQATGSLSSEQISQVVRCQLYKIQACYESELRKQPTLHGMIIPTFAITSAGRVDRVRIEETTMRSPEMEACIIKTFSKLRFPPQKAESLDVRYPLIFKKQN